MKSSNFIKKVKRVALLLLFTTPLFLPKNGEAKSRVEGFSREEKRLIKRGSESDLMRVFKITSKRDSLLLREIATPLNPTKERALIERLKNKMFATVNDPEAPGVGIAAPQVGISKRAIWVQRIDKEGEPFEFYLNPTIIHYSEQLQGCVEGCLSIPGERGDTKSRSLSVAVEYTTIEGEKRTEMVAGYTAVIFQHEIDHLNGILFIDYLK